MTHIDPELLAGLALGDAEALTVDDHGHLDRCTECRGEFDALRATLDESPETPMAGGLEIPDPQVWQRVVSELGMRTDSVNAGPPVRSATGVADVATATEPSRPAAPRDIRSGRRGPRRSLIVLVAAVLGIVVGAGGTLLVNRLGDSVEVLASTQLKALPGQTGSGTAQLVRRNGVEELQISIEGTVPATRFRELWLLSGDGRKMYALGVVSTSGRDAYPIPSALGTSLDGYTIVDISLEPYDGDAKHSGHSLLRGTLPG